MNEIETGKALGQSVPFLLFIVFLILKLTGTVAWSWWWVTAPLWIPFGLGAVIGVVVGVMVVAQKLKEQMERDGQL